MFSNPTSVRLTTSGRCSTHTLAFLAAPGLDPRPSPPKPNPDPTPDPVPDGTPPSTGQASWLSSSLSHVCANDRLREQGEQEEQWQRHGKDQWENKEEGGGELMGAEENKKY